MCVSSSFGILLCVTPRPSSWSFQHHVFTDKKREGGVTQKMEPENLLGMAENHHGRRNSGGVWCKFPCGASVASSRRHKRKRLRVSGSRLNSAVSVLTRRDFAWRAKVHQAPMAATRGRNERASHLDDERRKKGLEEQASTHMTAARLQAKKLMKSVQKEL